VKPAVRRVGASFAALVAAVGLAACSALSEETPRPTTFPAAEPDAAASLAKAFLEAWAAGDHAAMYELVDPSVRERYTSEQFGAFHAGFLEMAEAGSLGAAASGEPTTIALPPAPRPAWFPAPSPTPIPTADPSGATSSPTTDPTPAPSIDPQAVLSGPVPGMAVAFELEVASARFGDLALDRELTLVQGPSGWLVRWTPEVLFPELGADGTLELVRELGPRGRIVGEDALVWAETRDDGMRVYPQEALGGQVIGYATEVTAEDLERLGDEGYRAGDLVGRSGLEAGAEDLLRGTPGWSLVAVAGDGSRTVLYETAMVPGADVAITLDPELQAVAQQGLAGHGQGATVAIDPASGDVWALASAPSFNPNAMTIGTTLAGEPLEPADAGQIFNKAVLGAWPTGSSLKPFTLAAALDVGIVTPASTRTCPSSWRYNEAFTFRNFEDHTLPGQVTLAQAMAFSCNTTYMPLAYDVYLAQETALTDLLKEFGFGAATGIGYLVEEIGIVPDDAWLEANGRGGYTGFEQVQLAIGQGAFLATPLQVANAFATIGNGGTLWQPRIVTAATLPDGTTILEEPPTEVRQVSVSAENLAYVTDTLQAVVTLPYGTGTAAFAGFGLPVAGKSGTAETGGPDPHAWFPAYAPADAPTIGVATVLLNIRLGTGGTDAAPLVRQVMAAHFN
jgi:penicillin-binding protein 2